MKRMKKFLAFVLAMIMCLGMAVTASAEEKGKITVSNVTNGETYTVYRIFDADPSGTDPVIAYTASKTQRDYWMNDDSASVKYGLASPFLFTENIEGKYNVSKAEGFTDKDVTDALNNLFYVMDGDKKVLNTTVITQLVDAGIIAEAGKAEANTNSSLYFDVDYGYYLVTSSLGSIVTVNSTNRDVTVIDKNQSGPHWPTDPETPGKAVVDSENKVAVSNSASFGEVVKFRITVDTTNYVGEEFVKTYYIEDKLGTGLDYLDANDAIITAESTNNVDVTVKVGNTDITSDATITMTLDKHGFEVTIPWADVTEVEGVETLKNFIYSGSTNTIVIEYEAKVNENAHMAGKDDADNAVNNINTANFTYATGKTTDNPEPKLPYDETNEEETTTYTYALGIQKVDGNKAALENAKFIVSYVDAKDNKTKYIVVGTNTNDDGSYNYMSSTESKDAASELTTNQSGQIVIKGIGAGTYSVIETAAPAGYNMVAEAVPVEAQMASATTYEKKITTYFDSEGNVTDTTVDTDSAEYTFPVNVTSATIVNRAGSLLPSTGGIGTTIFYVVGGLLAAGAGVLLITKKRMRKEQ